MKRSSNIILGDNDSASKALDVSYMSMINGNGQKLSHPSISYKWGFISFNYYIPILKILVYKALAIEFN